MLYLVDSPRIDEISSDPERLQQLVNGFLMASATTYRSLPFAEYTSLSADVAEEIELVVGAQSAAGAAILEVRDFARAWGLDGFLSYPVSSLSGGWRKFLSVALFSNRLVEARLYFDAATHLGDQRLLVLANNIRQQRPIPTVFWEYDPGLARLFLSPCATLLDEGDRLAEA